MDRETIVFFVALVASIILHEISHGVVALWFGDDTAKRAGRLTLNPVPHIDPFGSIILPAMGALAHVPVIGWAKPVPVNPRNYRNFKKGDIAVSLAGVVTNLIIAVICVPVVILVHYIGGLVPAIAAPAVIFQLMLIYGIQLNVALAAFNLIPIPPLDGSHVMKYLLPPAWGLSYQRIGRYGLVVLFLLISVGRPFLMIWFKPAFALIGALQQVIAPYLLPSQWTV